MLCWIFNFRCLLNFDRFVACARTCTYPYPYNVVIPLGYIPAPCIYDLVIGSKPRKTVSRWLYRTWFHAPEHVRAVFGNTKTKGLRFFSFSVFNARFYSLESLRFTDLFPEQTHVIVCAWRTRLNPSEYYYPFKRARLSPGSILRCPSLCRFVLFRVFVSCPRADNARRSGSKQIENGTGTRRNLARQRRVVFEA